MIQKTVRPICEYDWFCVGWFSRRQFGYWWKFESSLSSEDYQDYSEERYEDITNITLVTAASNSSSWCSNPNYPLVFRFNKKRGFKSYASLSSVQSLVEIFFAHQFLATTADQTNIYMQQEITEQTPLQIYSR